MMIGKPYSTIVSCLLKLCGPSMRIAHSWPLVQVKQIHSSIVQRVDAATADASDR